MPMPAMPAGNSGGDIAMRGQDNPSLDARGSEGILADGTEEARRVGCEFTHYGCK